ncbi:heme exporter protein CcmB [Sphingomonas sp. ID0503]|uniref:heme exporter protein CcmB n=1 Tax=Sphingomonas sp. ID0503 TaxID=3399691 RepID=UPI003AFAE19C
MRIVLAILGRDLRRHAAGGGAVLPVMFFLLVAVLFPFAVGPDGALLSRTGGGALWMAALLAALMPVDRLIAADVQAGILDQLALRGVPDETVAAAKLLAHWLSFGPPLMIAAVVAGGLLNLDGAGLMRVELGLLLGTPALAAIGLVTAALTSGLGGGSALTGLLALPLTIPVLIFGAGALGSDSAAALKLLAAVSLLMVAGAPFAAGAAMRSVRR